MLSQIKPLTQEERQLAHAAAEEAVMRDIGERPQRDHYNHHAAHRYPPLVTKLITGLCIALLLAATHSDEFFDRRCTAEPACD
jgi:hypothetical protein